MNADPKCPHCEGTGWKQVVRDGVEAVERCPCLQGVRQEALLAKARIPERFREASFDNFFPPSPRDNPIENEALTRVMLTAKGFARDYSPSSAKSGLMLQGPPGVGKTHLATAVLKELIGRGFECAFFDYQKPAGPHPAELQPRRRGGRQAGLPRGSRYRRHPA